MWIVFSLTKNDLEPTSTPTVGKFSSRGLSFNTLNPRPKLPVEKTGLTGVGVAYEDDLEEFRHATIIKQPKVFSRVLVIIINEGPTR